MAVTRAYVEAGSKGFVRGVRWAYVPYIVADAAAGVNGLARTFSPRPGDLVCFDWNGGSLAYGRTHDPKSAPLPAGTQDFMSFIYQQAVLPPAPGRARVPITTGTRFETHEIEVTPEETIETPLGTLRALPVRQLPRPGAESIQIWLAADYRYLPVRIRHYDRDGRFSGEPEQTGDDKRR